MHATSASLWSESDWQRLNAKTTLAATNNGWAALVRSARQVMRAYSTSFFLVTRFLPESKRCDVEVIYASVRYPDEIVDTFPMEPPARHRLLDACRADYETSLACGSFAESLAQGCSPFIAGFADIVRRRGIPVEHYRAFLAAMRLDVTPPSYATLDDLIEKYIYGSATVVGYFLTYVYGASKPEAFDRALCGARNLAIALQLTNFLRDVSEDQGRGRGYIPLDYLAAEGLSQVKTNDESETAALARVIRRLSLVTENFYSLSERDLDAFAEDSRVAIRACIDVYRRLNIRIGENAGGVPRRQTVSIREKFAVLPASKYWRLPLAWVGML